MSIQDHTWRANHQLFCGQSGTGKTTLAESIVRKERAVWKFVFDAKGGEIAGRFKLPACYTGDDLAEAVARRGWVIFNPMYLYPGRFKEAFVFFCSFVWEISTALKGRKLFFVDELHRWTHKHKTVLEWQTILDLGRTFQLDTFSISTRPNSIYTETRAGFTKVFAFRQIDGNATEFFREAGIDETKVKGLRNGEYLWRDVDSGESGAGGKAF